MRCMRQLVSGDAPGASLPAERQGAWLAVMAAPAEKSSEEGFYSDEIMEESP